MSFILDALKKSESDRQRQTGPALFEVKVAPPKARFPIWAVAIVALLVINMGIVAWLLLRRSSHADETAATTAPAASASAAVPGSDAGTAPSAAGINNTPAPGAASVTGTAAAPTTPPFNSTPAGNPPQAGNMSPANSPPASSPPAAATSSPLVAAQGQFSPPANQQSNGQARLPGRDRNEPTLAANARQADDANTDATGNPDDFAPAAEPGSPLFKGHVRRGTESGLTLYQDAALVPGANLPELRLDLHVYAVKPQDRFALINMHKLHEGDSVQNGVRVESITPDGVVMSHNGSKFLLPRE
jgi:general secretion pathway protein B